MKRIVHDKKFFKMLKKINENTENDEQLYDVKQKK